jgi:ATP-dependent DNA helicase RecQ
MSTRRVTDVEVEAREELGLQTLRPGQEEAVEALLEGRDVLAVMPTGYGKSAIYQLAGLLEEGLTLVVSPLIALQRDQLDALEELAVPAAELNSTLGAHRRREVLASIRARTLRFVFLAPEQLANPETMAALRSAPPGLFVVDEAHIIGEWGHDFRPEYLRLGAAVDELGKPPVLALTATAAPTTRAEIVERLRMDDPYVVVRGFDRPNIWLGVRTFFDDDDKVEALLRHTLAAEKPGIVYAATRRGAEGLAEALAERGARAEAYHAGLPKSARDAVQDAFMTDGLEVVVATIAFGMGIDKPNVRFVFHSDISDSVDAYYQEVGRSGRDGVRADALLFYRSEDLGLRRFFGGTAHLEAGEVEAVLAAVAGLRRRCTREQLAERTSLTPGKVGAVLDRLEQLRAVEIALDGTVTRGATATDAHAVLEAQEERREVERSRLEMIRAYAELRDCRRKFLLNYFGEGREEPCGFCDNCEAGRIAESVEEPFPLESRVRHAAWGEGAVQRYEGDKLVVLFDRHGYKTLDLDLVEEKHLLARLD